MSNYHITPEQALEIAKILQSHGFRITVSEEDSIDFHDAVALAAYSDAVLDKVLGEHVAPDSDDFLRLSMSGCSLKVGWGDNKRIVCAPHIPLPSCTIEQQQQWMKDAERLCNGWNRYTTIKQQRDELLAALKQIEFATKPDPDDGSHHENAWSIASTAIEKIEGTKLYAPKELP